MFGQQDDVNSGSDLSGAMPGAGAAPTDTPAPSWNMPAPATPAVEPAAADGMPAAPASTPVMPTSDSFTTNDPPAASPDPTPAPDAPSIQASDDLVDLKQQALQQLSPLVGQLDQSPEEKFRTTMMMIQASDNQALLKEAFNAAQAIGDDKQRAQALLDVINEINYFTQQTS